jgi:hypothetical protein
MVRPSIRLLRAGTNRDKTAAACKLFQLWFAAQRRNRGGLGGKPSGPFSVSEVAGRREAFTSRKSGIMR